MKVLVTGAGGLLGRHLVRLLVAAGHDVIAMVRANPRAEHAMFFPLDRTTFVHVDLLAPKLCELPGNIDAVFSLAQSEHFRNFPEKAEEIFAVNVTANVQLLQWATRNRVSKFVLASSGGIYGTRHGTFINETDLLAVDSPLGFYLGTKLCSEVVFQNYRQFFGTAVILRPFFIYGPGQRRDMLIPRLIDSVRTGNPIQLEGSDGLRLNPVYVEDAAQAFAAALALEGCHVVNVAGPEVLTLRGIGEAIGRAVGRSPVFEHISGRSSDYIANIDLVRAMLAIPWTGFERGLRLTLGAI